MFMSNNAVDGSEILDNHSLDGDKTPVHNGMNYQAQVVSRISEPSTVSA